MLIPKYDGTLQFNTCIFEKWKKLIVAVWSRYHEAKEGKITFVGQVYMSKSNNNIIIQINQGKQNANF